MFALNFKLNKNINNKFIGECGHQLDKLLNEIPDTQKKLNIQSVNRFNSSEIHRRSRSSTVSSCGRSQFRLRYRYN